MACRSSIMTHGISLMNTVLSNKEKYRARQVKSASLARRLFGIVRRPSPKDFLGLMASNMIRNCPVTIDDMKIAYDIFGLDEAALKSKTVWRTPRTVTANIFAKYLLKLYLVITILL